MIPHLIEIFLTFVIGSSALFFGQQSAVLPLDTLPRSSDRRASLQETPQPQPPADEPDIEQMNNGRTVYLNNYCGTCHTLAAIDARGVFGPSHDHIATIATERIANPLYRGKAATGEEYIRESILEPGIYIAPGGMLAHQQMPPFSQLSQEDLDSLVYFLMQQK
ncbi:MAG: cytochrome c [Caldilineaceae bacterium]|nr:cytochrome c [Caldilineaceae bacterium]